MLYPTLTTYFPCMSTEQMSWWCPSNWHVFKSILENASEVSFLFVVVVVVAGPRCCFLFSLEDRRGGCWAAVSVSATPSDPAATSSLIDSSFGEAVFSSPLSEKNKTLWRHKSHLLIEDYVSGEKKLLCIDLVKSIGNPRGISFKRIHIHPRHGVKFINPICHV